MPTTETNAPVAPTTATPSPTRSTTTAPSATPSSNEARASVAEAPPDGDRPIESLLAAESFAVYGEVRHVGQLVEHEKLKLVLDSLNMLEAQPPEVTAVLEFLKANAETLRDARLSMSLMPVRDGLPNVLMALQLSTEQSAASFEPKLRAFIAGQLPPSRDEQAAAASQEPRRAAGARTQQVRETALPGFFMRRAGSWLLTADESFTFKKLRGGSRDRPLGEDARLQAFRSRLASEPFFVYIDTELIKRSSQMMMEKRMREYEKAQGGVAGSPRRRAGRNTERAAVVVADDAPPPAPSPTQVDVAVAPDEPDETPAPVATPEPTPAATEQTATGTVAGDSTLSLTSTEGGSDGSNPDSPPSGAVLGVRSAPGPSNLQMMLNGLLYGSVTRMPEGIGIAAGFEGDTVAVRALVSNPSDGNINIIPFISSIISGPQVASSGQMVAPLDSEVFVSASLNWGKIYNSMLEEWKAAERRTKFEIDSEARVRRQAPNDNNKPTDVESNIAAIETLLGFKIKEDLLPALGNEVAVSAPFSWFDAGRIRFNRNSQASQAESDSRAGMAAFVAVNNPEMIRKIMPRVLSALGMFAPGVQAQTEKREGFDIQHYGVLSYTIVGGFLVISEQAAAVRHVVDSYAAQQTLASSNSFRDAMSWQPRQSLAQLYVSDALVAGQLAEFRKMASESLDPALQDLPARLNLEPAATTYVATDEGDALLHEVRVPLSLLQTFTAGAYLARRNAPFISNEMTATFMLSHLRDIEEVYKRSKGRYGTLEELKAEKLTERNFSASREYRFDVRASGDGFEATATPVNYAKTGRRSFFLDESGIIRAADHKGQPASAGDPPID